MDAPDDPLRIVDDPSPANQAAFLAALKELEFGERLELLAADPDGFQRMAVYPDGSHLQMAVAYGTIDGEPDAPPAGMSQEVWEVLQRLSKRD